MENVKCFEVDTNLHCQGCVEKVRSALDASSKITNWGADINGLVKLQIEGSISKGELNALLNENGYEITSNSHFLVGQTQVESCVFQHLKLPDWVFHW